jgi:hypothetical protein
MVREWEFVYDKTSASSFVVGGTNVIFRLAIKKRLLGHVICSLGIMIVETEMSLDDV